jgi:hypothetical protein
MKAERQECLRCADRPTCPRGYRVVSGKFVRSLCDNEVSKRYERDGEPPEFDYRVKPYDWGWEPKDAYTDDGLSVNLQNCANSLRCAILFHPTPDRFCHAVIIDVAALCEVIDMQVIAVYDPDPDDFENPCHFYLMPLEKTVADLEMAIKAWYKDVLSQLRKPPRQPHEIERARLEQQKYARVFEIHRNVHSPSTQPSLPSTTSSDEDKTVGHLLPHAVAENSTTEISAYVAQPTDDAPTA